MKGILSKILLRLESGEDIVLCRILSASGSSPRGAGALMAVFPDGSTLGTVGGGSMESEVRKQALMPFSNGTSFLRSYQLHSDVENDLGMICGGEVRVLFQMLHGSNSADLSLLREAVEMSERRCDGWLILCLRDGRICDAGLWSSDHGLLFLRTVKEPELLPLLRGTPQLSEGAVCIYTEPLCQRERVIIFGGGHVGCALVPVLSPLGFYIEVLESRPWLCDPARFPLADVVTLCDFGRIAEAVTICDADYAVVMTPGHQSDLTVLSQVLHTKAAYIGCIGSRRKIAKTNELLLSQGFTTTDLERIHAPIGLPIGAETPEEIAVSVAAELIAFRSALRREKELCPTLPTI